MGIPALDNLVKIGALKAEPCTLEHTIGLPAAKWRVLDKAHRDRNLAEYEGVFDVDEVLIRDLLKIADEVLGKIRALGSVRPPAGP